MLTNIIDKFKFRSEWDIMTRVIVVACVVIPPFFLAYGGVVSFVDAIYLAGTFGGIIMSIIPIMMLKGAREKGDIVNPVWTAGWIAHPFIQTALIVIFCGGAIYAIISMLGFLPAGW